MTIDPNNRPGGDTLILTAKSANKIQWFDARTLAHLADRDMPASTHELIRSPDGAKVYASVYGGGIFGKNKDPDRRIAVIDLASKSLERTIDVGANIAPHSVLMDASRSSGRRRTWQCGPGHRSRNRKVDRIDIGSSPIGSQSVIRRKTFCLLQDQGGSGRSRYCLAQVLGILDIQHGAEGIAVSPTKRFSCAHTKGIVHVSIRTHALRKAIEIEVRRARPTSCAACGFHRTGDILRIIHVDSYAAVYDAATLKQLGGLLHPRHPWVSALRPTASTFLCCHDAAVVLEFNLGAARITREFQTAAGCEFIVSY